MSKINNNIKFYTFIDVISTYSDDNTSISIKEINNHMKDRIGVTLDRRTIYSYINDMKFLDLDVSDYNEETRGYNYINHKLEEYEIRILVDAILSSKFITKKKTRELINKLIKLNSIYISNDLHRHVFVDDRAKSINEEIFINIDKISNAIRNRSQITFNYYDYNYEKVLMPRKNSANELKTYILTPIAMILKNENYYLVSADDTHSDLSNYRIDRMKNIKVTDKEARELNDIEDCINGFNSAVYSRKSFKMFPGDERMVKIRFNRNLLNFMIDEFGDNIDIAINNDGSYNGQFIAKVGDGLVRWILQLGRDAIVISPDTLKDSVKKELNEIISLY